jgi:hypothetical protein
LELVLGNAAKQNLQNNVLEITDHLGPRNEKPVVKQWIIKLGKKQMLF